MSQKFVTIEFDAEEAKALIGNVRRKALYSASKKAINKVGKEIHNSAIATILTRIKLKKKEIKNLLPFAPAKQSRLDKLRAYITAIGTTIPLLLFVKGSRLPENQKGKTIKQRRKLRVEIQPGKSEQRPKYFIQKSKFKHRLAGQVGVFSRIKGAANKWAHQSVPGIRQHFLSIIDNLEARAARDVGQRFIVELTKMVADSARKNTNKNRTL